MALYEEMRERDIACNTITYNTMLNAFAQCGAMHRVPELLEDMKAATPPVEPDIVTYSTMVKGFCASGDLDKGLQLLKEMELDGKFAPDEVMYNSLLDGCARQHRLDDALKLLGNMRDSGVTPSNYTLSIMVKLLGRASSLNQAFTLVKSLCDEHNFKANIQVYTCLIQACFHNRHPMKALAIHDQLVEERCVPDQKTYVALVRGCLQAGLVDKAAAVVRCAFHCRGHDMQQADGPAPGVDRGCLQEVLAKLGSGSDAAHSLQEDIAAAQDTTKPRRLSPRRKQSSGESLPWRSANKGSAGN
jgi:pentatricopeptide repeat protein